MKSPPPWTLATQERRFQFVVVGGLVALVAIVALAPHTERALFENGRLPLAFAAVVPEAPPAVGVLRRFGYMAPQPFARAFRTDRRSPNAVTEQPETSPAVAPDAQPFFASPDEARPPVLVADAGALAPVGVFPGGALQFASFSPGASGLNSGGTAGTPVAETPVTTTPEPGATPTPEATPTPTPSATPTPTPSATPAPEAMPTPGTTPEPQPTATPAPEPTATPEPLPTATPIPEPTPVLPPIVTPTPDEPVTAVPEPATWMMLLTGMGIVAAAVRRSRRRQGRVAEA
ncbi:PEPxxWA-CTERM sorting domain-containing protein [Sphingomonas sp. KR1UV-12]|uniref:PEPxxWA-CTERM sorting domain-containing protein n=1 Tax=Sphingomonas aurea TaxID=3063994 RepID=A0ABT9EM98_9SPHN|nr:PEPxxWA-CTERM sorting domain-containing protein [Sphingomonas sp. KR1UV-12]MDP1028074.1 PEPxxWA-CTERM sorting domain-containing protein [Sphingomonas sp. KR1UV-12]